MDKSLKPAVATKWDSAPGFVGSMPFNGQYEIGTNSYRSLDYWPQGMDFIPDGNGGQLYRCNYDQYYLAYRDCAPLQAVINKLAQAHANGAPCIQNTDGKAKNKESTKPQATKIKNRLNNPNPLQTQDEFEAQGKIFQKVFGFNVVFLLRPIGFESYDAEEMWNLPRNMLDIRLKNRSFIGQKDSAIESITLCYAGLRVPLPLVNCYIQKDFTPSFETVVLPESRIRALSQQINNIIEAYDSRGSLIRDRGAMGILSSGFKDQIGTTAIPEEDLQSIQSQQRRYGVRTGQFRYIVTKAALSFSQTGYATKDLMLFEEIEDDVTAICNGYDYPPRLMGIGKSNALSESDVQGFSKLLYQENIIPVSMRDAAFWNKVFNTAEFGIEISYDFSDLPVLQEDRVKVGLALEAMTKPFLILWEAGATTINEWRVALELEPIVGEQFDMYQPQYDKWLKDNGLAPRIKLSLTESSQVNTLQNGTGTQGTGTAAPAGG